MYKGFSHAHSFARDINVTHSTWPDCSILMSAYRPVLVNLRFSARSFTGIVQPLFSVCENLSTYFCTFAEIAPRLERTLYMASGPCAHCLNLSARLVQGNCSTIAIVSTLIIFNLKHFQDHVMSFHHLSSRQSNH